MKRITHVKDGTTLNLNSCNINWLLSLDDKLVKFALETLIHQRYRDNKDYGLELVPLNTPPMPPVQPPKPKQKEIKTITKYVTLPSHANDFDEKVNCLIKDGYTLKKREFYFSEGVNKNHCLYAELEKEI